MNNTKRSWLSIILISSFLIVLLTGIWLQASPVYALNFEKFLNSKEAVINLNANLSSRVINWSQMRNITLIFGLYPENSSYQRIMFMSTHPQAIKENHLIKVIWKKEDIKDRISFILNSKVETLRKYPVVNHALRLNELADIVKRNESLKEYVKKTDRFDYDNRIRERASSIVEGSTNEFTAVSKIAFWIYNNLNYDLNYSNEVKNATWVYENMRGTCDEFSTLMIAMLRSLDIPSREVQGFAYSNIPAIKGFNAHSWVEVYFPDYGWQEFDPSYGEFGSMDVTHIKFVSPNISYSWYGYKAKLMDQKNRLSARVLNYSGKVNMIELKTGVFKKETGIESYNVVFATARNLLNSYVAECLKLSGSDAFKVLDNNEKCFVIKPGGNYTVAWLIKNENLNSKYVYTIPISVYNNEIEENTSFQSSVIYDNTNYEEASLFKKNIESHDNTANRRISFNCYPSELYPNEREIKCYFTNTGNIGFKKLKVCLDKECKYTELLINEEQELDFNLSHGTNRTTRVNITYSAGNESWNDFLELKALRLPKYNLSLEKNETNKELILYLNISGSGGINKKIRIVGNDFSLKREVKQPRITIEINKNLLRVGNNTIKVIFWYQDKHYRSYSKEKEFKVYIKNKDLLETIEYYVYIILNKIKNFFT